MRGNKGFIFMCAFLLVLSIYGVSAQATNNCLAGQTIVSLYDSNNSHGAIYSDAGAGYKICYNQIFGEEYIGLNANTCLPGNSNAVIKLSAVTDAHAEAPNQNNYAINVCYGTMACTLRTGSCNFGENIALRLSNYSNAHLANSSYISYTKLICCSEKPLGFNSVAWKDATQDNLPSNPARNSKVRLIANTNFSAGAPVTFEIFESDIGEGGGVQDIRKIPKNLSAIVDSNGVASADWTITKSDIDSGRAYDETGGDSNQLEFYFNASYGGYKVSSSIMPTSKIAGTLSGGCALQIDNKIIRRGIYFVNTSLEFNNTRAGEGLSLSWIVEENGEVTKRLNANSFVINFSNPGQKTITLVGDMVGCVQQSDEISILVIDNSANKLFAFINNPSNGEVIKFGGQNQKTVNVAYNATDSYVISPSMTGCGGSIICLAGNCPTTTSGLPLGCSGSNIPVSGIPKPFSDVNFTWSEVVGNIVRSPFETGIEKSSKSITYYRSDISNALNDKKVKLIVNYSNGGVSLENIFFRKFTLGMCLDGGKKVIKLNANGNKAESLLSTIASSNSSDAPYDPNACSSNGDGTCCPIGYACVSGKGCVISEDIPTSCSDLTATGCLTNPYRDFAAQADFNRMYPDLASDCLARYECSWTGIKCELNTSQVDASNNVLGSCIQTAQFDVCSGDDATQQITVDATVENSDKLTCLACNDRTYDIPCGRPAVELPFFGFYQIILSILGIVFIYTLLLRSKKLT